MKLHLVGALLLGLVFTSQAQIEVKGIKLGEKYYGEKEISTSLGGISGTLNVLIMEDNVVYGFEFQNLSKRTFLSGNGKGYTEERRNGFGIDELNDFIEGFEKNFGVKFKKVRTEKKSPDSDERFLPTRTIQTITTEKGSTIHNDIYYSYSNILREGGLQLIGYGGNEFSVEICNLKLKQLKEDRDKNDKKQKVLNDF